MSQIVSYRDQQMLKKDFKKKVFEVVKQDQMSKYYSEQVYPSGELVFLQSQSNFIEKTLGSGEKMKLRFECLVAHAPTVKISRTPVHDFELNHRGQLQLFSSKNKFITLQGPGLVYIDMQAGERFFKEVQMSLFTLLLYVALYVIMAIIVWADKRDGKS